MRMQMDRNVQDGLHSLDQRISVIRKQQTCHILDGDDVRAHLLKAHSQLDEIVLIMDRACGIGEAGLADTAIILDVLHGRFDVAGIVQSIEDTYDFDTVVDGFLYKLLDNIIRIVLVSQQVLTTQQHLQLGLRGQLLDGAQTLPGIFIQETHADIEGSAAPALQGPISDIIQDRQCRDHVLDPHTGRGLGLVGITQDGICDL